MAYSFFFWEGRLTETERDKGGLLHTAFSFTYIHNIFAFCETDAHNAKQIIKIVRTLRMESVSEALR